MGIIKILFILRFCVKLDYDYVNHIYDDYINLFYICSISLLEKF